MKIMKTEGTMDSCLPSPGASLLRPLPRITPISYIDYAWFQLDPQEVHPAW